MKRIILIPVCLVTLVCICIKQANAQSTILSAGIQGGIGAIGEVFPEDTDDTKNPYDTKINHRLFLDWGFFGEVKFIQPGNWFHDIYFAYDRSKGRFSYENYNNDFTAESYTAMYRIGAYSGSGEEGNNAMGLFIFGGAGLALDRYLAGDFTSDTNSLLAGKPYLLRPLFCAGAGYMLEHVTFNFFEFRMDMRFQRQPQNDFRDYLNWDGSGSGGIHWLGMVGIYSGIAYNF